jgi:hypothetical protein
MKDGLITIYIPADKFHSFIVNEGGLDETSITVIGRPRWDDPDFVEVDIAFSEMDVDPMDWSGEDLQNRVDDLRASWEKIYSRGDIKQKFKSFYREAVNNDLYSSYIEAIEDIASMFNIKESELEDK